MNPFWLPIFFKEKPPNYLFGSSQKRAKNIRPLYLGHLGTSAAIENRGGEHPSTFYFPALVWVIFGIPPDEWIPLVRSVCVSWKWGCVKLHFCWGICLEGYYERCVFFLCDVLIGWPPFKHKKNGSFLYLKQISLGFHLYNIQVYDMLNCFNNQAYLLKTTWPPP